MYKLKKLINYVKIIDEGREVVKKNNRRGNHEGTRKRKIILERAE